jgi:hypothetical protein
MMRCVRVLAVLCVTAVGCGRIAFDRSTDAASDPAPDVPSVVECPSDPRLVACYDFEGVIADRSGHGNDAVGQLVTFVPGVFRGRAMRTAAASRADLTAPSLDLTQYTVEGWIRPAAHLGNGLVFDHDSRWALVVRDDAPGTVRVVCDTALLDVVASAIPIDAWTHVACVHDGNEVRALVGGIQQGSEVVGPVMSGTRPAAVAGNAPPTDPAAPYLGDVDQLRVWNVALTPSELCALAGC